jgi:muramoyltetrapeptide carboxypeptidase
MNQNKLIKPEKLKQGDTIGIISPAGSINPDNLQKAVQYFEIKGYKIKIAPHAMDKKNYLAGSDKDRLCDLMDFFNDQEIKAILCSRGGYGTYRLLKDIDYKIINVNPKIFMGYSDITALLVNITEKSNLITFHAPLFLSDFGMDTIDEYTEKCFFDIIEGKIQVPFSYSNPIEYQCITSGETEGELIAGNLAVLAGLLGTPYFPNIENKILLLEDIGEPLYKIDRMLMQLKLAGIFDKISGLLFGEFTEIDKSEDQEISKTKVKDLIYDIISDYKIPTGFGFPSGHGKTKATIPLGVKYYFNSQKFTLKITEEYLNS